MEEEAGDRHHPGKCRRPHPRPQDFEFQQYEKIKELCPNGFHQTDKKGRPIFLLQVGQIKFMELMTALHNSKDTLVHYFVKELEHTWRVKFQECQDVVYSKGVDQMTAIVDLKGCTLKALSNQQMLQVYKQLVLEVQRFFPELLYRMYIVNAPIFFENIWETELSSCVDPETIKSKIFISTSNTHEDLLAEVSQEDLPSLYGGTAEARATCIYSDKGPWSEGENLINYRDPNSRRFDDSDEDDLNDMSESNAGFGQMKMMMGGPSGGGGLGGLGSLNAKLNALSMGQKQQEEFKLVEGDED